MTASQVLLSPLSVVYGAVASLRARAYAVGALRSRRLPGTVISVGNLTTGGTGKTPTVLWVAQRLVAEGKRVAILTRGYKGSATSSDEVRLLMSRLGDGVGFGVGADRYEQGLALSATGYDWFVLDDGYQHMQLARDVNVLLVDATNPFGGGKLLPAGRMREPHSAVRRADVIVITRSAHAPGVESAIRRDSAAPTFYADFELTGLKRISSDGAESVANDDASARWFAFCGIGNPGAFLQSLKNWKMQVAGHMSFPDHHRYSGDDIREIVKAARDVGATAIICTEKDRFNLPEAVDFGLPAYFCSIALTSRSEEELWRTILATAAGNSAARGGGSRR